MKNIYIVTGATGEYSGHREWAVMAYFNKEAAHSHATNAARRAEELAAAQSDRYSAKTGPNEFDPNMQMDYTGTEYFVRTVPLWV